MADLVEFRVRSSLKPLYYAVPIFLRQLMKIPRSLDINTVSTFPAVEAAEEAGMVSTVDSR